MKRYNLSEIMKNAHRSYKYSGKQQGKTFGEVLKATWKLAKLQALFTQEAVKARTDKFLTESNEAIRRAVKSTPSKAYNDLSIPSSAYYNPNSTGRNGAHYEGD